MRDIEDFRQLAGNRRLARAAGTDHDRPIEPGHNIDMVAAR
jgi:hypothetical protein